MERRISAQYLEGISTFLFYLPYRLRAVRGVCIELAHAAPGRHGYVCAAPPPSDWGEAFADPLLPTQAGDMHPLTFRLSNATPLFPFIRSVFGWNADVLCVLSSRTTEDLGVCGHQLDTVQGPKVLSCSARADSPEVSGLGVSAAGHHPEVEHRLRPVWNRKLAGSRAEDVPSPGLSSSTMLAFVEGPSVLLSTSQGV